MNYFPNTMWLLEPSSLSPTGHHGSSHVERLTGANLRARLDVVLDGIEFGGN